ncbi:hypothetical protein DFH11DRAFT_1517134 [Phellopilus nigrolimitatus]|nr:hypothetical protein DFH11DRAFT_1517134 [Phellopilus nigrolimitatus]
MDETCNFAVTLARNGCIATSPLHPSSAFSINILELYRHTSSRCPSLSIQAFMRAICDLHQISFNHVMRKHFSEAFDVYLEIINLIKFDLDNAMFKSSFSQIEHDCPACAYRTQDEAELKFSLLCCMDGNSSLKRLYRTRNDGDDVHTGIEVPDERTRASHLFVEAAEVDEFKDEVKRRRPAAKVLTKTSPCVDRWKNLSQESKKRMWGVFQETGVFIVSCRHGVVLKLCDMIRSGELAKYPLALIDKVVKTFGEDIMCGYDIGCGFSTTASKSAKLGKFLKEKRCRFCVNAFHGHAHCRPCQLRWHPLYTEGAGLEDFEGCERIFSESNKVAACTRHASVFHRRQAIIRHFTRWNADKYAELSHFLKGNYVQALTNITNMGPEFERAKQSLGIASNETILQWHAEEKGYLKSLKDAPQVDLLAMSYVESLKNLHNARQNYHAVSGRWQAMEADNIRKVSFYLADTTRTQSIETQRITGLDRVLTLQSDVELKEAKLGVKMRWTENDEDWKKASRNTAMRDYQRAIDSVEGLVVQRLFEISRLNRAGTCDRLRTHISKALQSRSKAIRNAVARYNLAADGVFPARPRLDIKTVLEYVFLGQFDLLRDSRFNVQDKPWAHAAEREAILAYFKLERSREEIVRLNVEVRRLSTFIRDSERDMDRVVSLLKERDLGLAHQMEKRQTIQRSVNNVHRKRLTEIEGLRGFSGERGSGTYAGNGARDGAYDSRMCAASETNNEEVESSSDEEDDDEEGADAIIDLLTVAYQE